MANRILPGYEMQVGTKKEIVFDHDGPASYANPGGDVINAADLGLGGIEYGEADGLSSDGLNYAYAAISGVSTSGTQANVGTTLTMRWFVVATGAEVANTTNLSAKAIRIRIRGV